MTMVRRALLLTILAAVLKFSTPFLFFIANDVRIGRMPLANFGILNVMGVLSFLVWILFLVRLYQEISGHVNIRQRKIAAYAAVAGQAFHLVSVIWSSYRFGAMLKASPPGLQRFGPEIDATRQWVLAAVWQMLPIFAWIAFLLIFAKYAAPFGRAWTWKLAAILCFLTVVRGLRESYAILFRIPEYFYNLKWWPIETSGNLAGNALALFSWLSLALLFFSIARLSAAEQLVVGRAEEYS